ncbi:MAG: cobyrinate a,c-diamide synthase [Lachnospiraceae bacterium]|nr:cobyrinate a,c-diamide synthase [Lachnospiraceae bacterium]
MPRILFAAPKSGSGKTMLTCGMIEVLKRRSFKVASFKCGPDYIDPMFHRQVLGIPSGNLDTFFTDAQTTRFLLAKKAAKADITVLEGVMGYYDGLGGQSEKASTYEVACVTETPVILVVDGKGASVSLAAVIKGIVEYRADSRIEGIILNRVSEGYYGRLKELIESECKIRVLGYLPQLEGLTIPSRHLGLVAPQELPAFQSWVCQVADAIERCIDVEQVLSLAKGAKALQGTAPELPHLPEGRCVRLAVARDEAFSFYYTENLELLKQMGAELVEFSPLHDTALPEQIDGLLLGGGYPENYAAELAAAEKMRAAVKAACEKGLPCLAECGGFLYLQDELEDAKSTFYPMTGVLCGKAFRTDRLCRFGYVTVTNKKAGVLGDAGCSVKGHEFHYWDCSHSGSDCTAVKPAGGTEYSCMVHTRRMAAGFPHLYYYSNPQMIYQFLLCCSRYQSAVKAKKRWDDIAKPIDSLGLLEDYVVRLCRIAGDEGPFDLTKRALVILCGDHGVVKEGVTQTGSEVTKIVSENFAKGCSSVNYLAKAAGVDVFAVDIGMDTPPYPQKELVKGAVVDRKVARGTGNIFTSPAMSDEQCRQALAAGMQLVRELKVQGYRIVATGEMGIGNTTPTSVLAGAFLNLPADKVTGKGAGLSAQGMQKKCQVVGHVLDRIRQKKLQEPVDILAEAGGYEIAGMAGVFLGGVREGIPIVIDGAISAVAALTAMQIDDRVADYVIASHESEEIAGRLALRALSAEAIVHGRMCLGEGTGAVMVFPLLDMAMEVYRNMGTFDEYSIEPYERYGDNVTHFFE